MRPKPQFSCVIITLLLLSREKVNGDGGKDVGSPFQLEKVNGDAVKLY
jgi:hypothetical protein